MNKKLVILIKLICIIHIIVFLPKIISQKGAQTKSITNQRKRNFSSFENLINNEKKFNWLKKIDLAIISNNSTQANHMSNLLLKKNFKIKKIIIPTHLNKLSQINTQTQKIPTINWALKKAYLLKNSYAIDAFIFNMNSSGLKNDLSYKALLKTIKVAKKQNKKIIILDKPNPLGYLIEGAGIIPLQYGLTIGELGHYFNRYLFNNAVDLTIIPMIGWKRNNNNYKARTTKTLNKFYSQLILNILNSIKPINFGINKDVASGAILLPENNSLSLWETNFLKKICFKLGFSCSNYSYYDQRRKMTFKGIRLELKDLKNFSAFNSLITITRFLNNRKNIKLQYSDLFYKMVESQDIKDFVQKKLSFNQLQRRTINSLNNYYNNAKKCFLYAPYPKISGIKLARG